MQKRHTILFILLTLITNSKLIGQGQLPNLITYDSLVKKFKIQQVTENWFTSPSDINPSNTTYEIFDKFGIRMQRVHINYFYHKFINTYSYESGVILDRQEYYDWNPHRVKNQGDTILKKSVHKYFTENKKRMKIKVNKIENYVTKSSYDTEGLLIQQIDTIKFGYEKTTFTYNEKGQLTERRRFISRFLEMEQLKSIDSLFYFTNSHLVSKEINYYDIRSTENQNIYNRIIERTFRYNELGLIIEKEILEKYLSLNNQPKPTIYKYEYKFFE